MSNKDLLRMAHLAGFNTMQLESDDPMGKAFKEILVKYTALVQAATAEECAKVCDERAAYWSGTGLRPIIESCSEDIRAKCGIK